MTDSTRKALENAEYLKVLYELADASYGEIESAYKKETQTTLQVWAGCIIITSIIFFTDFTYLFTIVSAISISLAFLALTRETRKKENIRNLNIQFTPEIKKILSLVGEQYSGKKEYYGFNWDGRLLIVETIKRLFDVALHEIQDSISINRCYGEITVHKIKEREFLVSFNKAAETRPKHKKMECVCDIVKFILDDLGIKFFEGPEEFIDCHSRKFSFLKNSFVVIVE